MEMRRFTRRNNMVAKLHVLWRPGVSLLALKQIADALLSRYIRQHFMPTVSILTGAHLVTHVKLHHAVFDDNHIDVRGIAFAVVLLDFGERFPRLFFRFLAEYRVQISGQQIAIDRFPNAFPIGEWAIFDILESENTLFRFLLNLGQCRSVILVPMR